MMTVFTDVVRLQRDDPARSLTRPIERASDSANDHAPDEPIEGRYERSGRVEDRFHRAVSE